MENFQTFKPEHEYAIVMTSRGWGLHPGMNAVINGLDYYDNEVDLFLIHGNDENEYLERIKTIPNLKVKIIPVPIDICRTLWPDYKKDEGWQNIFFRYKVINLVGQKYHSIMMCDSDMFCCNNIMKYFEVVTGSNLIMLPSNPWGSSVEACKTNWARICTGASAPPFHCMPLFLDAKRHQEFLNKVWERGKEEAYLDMEILNRTIFAEKMTDKIFTLPNILWVHTSWYYDMVKRVMYDGKIYLESMEERINFVHRRWWMSEVCKKYVEDIDKDFCPQCYVKGRNNVKIFWEEYKRLNQTHKIKLDYDFRWFEDIKS